MSKRTIKAIQRESYVAGVFGDIRVEVGEVVEEVKTNEARNFAQLHGRDGWYLLDCDASPGDVVVTQTPFDGYARVTQVLP